MTTATAIANHLNIVESAIAQVEEWASVLFVRFVKGSPRFVSKKNKTIKEKPMKNKKGLFDGHEKFKKPQAKYSEDVRYKAKHEIQTWFQQEAGLSMYEAGLLARELVDEAKKQRINKISNDAPDVFLADTSKIEYLVMDAKKIADKLDEEEKLIPWLEDLVEKNDPQYGHIQG